MSRAGCAGFWWGHRHSGFYGRQQKLLNRLLDAEPEGFTGRMTLRKAIGQASRCQEMARKQGAVSWGLVIVPGSTA